MEKETDVHEFMRKTLVLPSFITPRFFDPSVYRYDKVVLSIDLSYTVDMDVFHSVMVVQVLDQLIKKIFEKFHQVHQRAYFVESQNHLISKFYRNPNVIIDPFLYVYLEQSSLKILPLQNKYFGSCGTVTKIGTFYDNNMYMNNTVEYHNNTLKTFDEVFGHIQFDSYNKVFDKLIYEFSICYEVVNPIQYHIFNEDNKYDDRLRLDLLNNYMMYKKTKEYFQKSSSSQPLI